MPDYAPFSDDTVVYIALRNTSYMDMESGDIKPNAFLLRAVDLGSANGISLIVCDNPPRLEDLATLAPRLKSKVCGIDALTVGDIRNLGHGLDVVRDAEHHAYIKGLPYIEAEDKAEARRAATLSELLALLCRRVDRL
jgi:hypothetical protein